MIGGNHKYVAKSCISFIFLLSECCTSFLVTHFRFRFILLSVHPSVCSSCYHRRSFFPLCIMQCDIHVLCLIFHHPVIRYTYHPYNYFQKNRSTTSLPLQSLCRLPKAVATTSLWYLFWRSWEFRCRFVCLGLFAYIASQGDAPLS